MNDNSRFHHEEYLLHVRIKHQHRKIVILHNTHIRLNTFVIVCNRRRCANFTILCITDQVSKI